ncbi:MAG: ATP-dependent DNA helicase [Rhodospirillales bacterium]|jgi:ATP-dependent DNA helicase DinG|nr:ATP-dependent DNA helicase [Rhodospirillales bacterium]HJO74644.1 ATP-dependent DNA helicase [Rhodospirillales bacterium]
MSSASAPPKLLLPQAPAVAAGVRQAAWLSPDGEIETLSLKECAGRLRSGAPPIVCHAKAQARRLGTGLSPALDVLELFAFVRPARFVLPTPGGLAAALGLALPGTLEREAESLLAASGVLLAELSERAGGLGDATAGPIARAMQLGGWPWADAVLAALGDEEAKAGGRAKPSAMQIWNFLDEWQDQAPETPPGNQPVDDIKTQARLSELLGGAAEKRGEQVQYALSSALAFQPPEKTGEPALVLAEAGTGIGKTLGYIAPASVWAEKNEGPVWISTFTRNLQRQLDAELDRLFPDPEEKSRRVVIRKGRENYLCLLNFDEALGRQPPSGDVSGGGGQGNNMTALGLMARWALATRDGDMVGGDFPAWLKDLMGAALTTDLTDTRGECIYSGCRHYGRCFVEHTVRRAKAADIVIANHALVMIQAALGGGHYGRNGGDENGVTTRYVFDEGHHLFGAADSAFSAHLTGRETAELRRWLVGAEEGSRSRSRGLRERIKDLIDGDDDATEALDEALKATRALPARDWQKRLGGDGPVGTAEAFLALVRSQVYARDGNGGAFYSLESETGPTVDGLLEAAAKLDGALARLNKPLGNLIRALAALLDTEAKDLDSQTRTRIETVCRSLDHRGRQQITAWRRMLQSLAEETPDEFVDWFGVERIDGREFDIGLHRHWVDPTLPFADAVIAPSHGVLVTSATLRDATGDAEADWVAAERRTGAMHTAKPPELTAEASPFDYAANTKVLIVGDVNRNEADPLAAAYRELFVAAGGGALGLFTAISRLRAVHQRIQGAMDEAGLTLLAQHVDVLDTGTLVDIFRAEENSCLLGTDAVRDGVDVPGRALRLIVFDRVPWPQPNILHRHRKKHFGGAAYDDMLTRLKLKQAYGRLIRRADDRGVFVMMDSRLPTRLLGAFPEDVEIHRVGLKDAITETRAFLADHN